MHSPTLLSEIEENVNRLPLDEKLLLMEHLSHQIRQNLSTQKGKDTQLSEMAADPEIQRELQSIEKEFSVSEQDGLGA